MLNDSGTKVHLTNLYLTGCRIAGIDPLEDAVKLMGRKKRYELIKYAYYIQLQNFDSLSAAKRSKSDVNVRYYIRCIQFKDRLVPLLEIGKWYPSLGDVESDVTIYRNDKDPRNKGDFMQFLVTLLLWTKYGL